MRPVKRASGGGCNQTKLARLQREHTRTLLAHLESLLPDEYRSVAKRNGAGARRAMGASGRSLTDVLNDTILVVSDIRNSPRLGLRCDSVGTRHGARPAAVVAIPEDGSLQQMLVASGSILGVEVEMGGEQDWIICNDRGRCAERMWRCAPWGACTEGHSFTHLIDHADFLAVDIMWKQLQQFGESGSAVVNIVSFFPSTSGGNQMLTCKYEPFEVRLFPLKASSKGATCRVLIFGTPVDVASPHLAMPVSAGPASSDGLSESTTTGTLLPCKSNQSVSL